MPKISIMQMNFAFIMYFPSAIFRLILPTIIPDPFELKKYSKFDIRRFSPTIAYRMCEYISRLFYPFIKPRSIESSLLRDILSIPSYPIENTSVTKQQIFALQAFCVMVNKTGMSICEIGCFRGVSTKALISISPNCIYWAIDPYQGYGGCNEDYKLFVLNTSCYPNLKHLCLPSGQALKLVPDLCLGLVFIDAVHDFWNTLFDFYSVYDKVANGGYIAFHDVDEPEFSGTRLAAQIASLFCRPVFYCNNLLILKKQLI